jgi:hypothetical protein
MKVLTDPQVSEIEHCLVEIEKNGNVQAVAFAERIRAIILQAEPVTLHLKC